MYHNSNSYILNRYLNIHLLRTTNPYIEILSFNPKLYTIKYTFNSNKYIIIIVITNYYLIFRIIFIRQLFIQIYIFFPYLSYYFCRTYSSIYYSDEFVFYFFSLFYKVPCNICIFKLFSMWFATKYSCYLRGHHKENGFLGCILYLNLFQNNSADIF